MIKNLILCLYRMNSLKEWAKRKIIEGEGDTDQQVSMKEKFEELSGEIQEQRLMIMELEENNGAVAQENAWLWEEIQLLKTQIVELESMVYGEQVR